MGEPRLARRPTGNDPDDCPYDGDFSWGTIVDRRPARRLQRIRRRSAVGSAVERRRGDDGGDLLARPPRSCAEAVTRRAGMRPRSTSGPGSAGSCSRSTTCPGSRRGWRTPVRSPAMQRSSSDASTRYRAVGSCCGPSAPAAVDAPPVRTRSASTRAPDRLGGRRLLGIWRAAVRRRPDGRTARAALDRSAIR